MRLDASESTLDRYRLERVIEDKPGFLTVYEGSVAANGERVSVRSFPIPGDRRLRKAFRRAAKARVTRGRPGLAPALEALEQGGRLHLVTEASSSPRLANRLAESPLQPQTAVHVFERIAAALDGVEWVRDAILDPTQILLEENSKRGVLLDPAKAVSLQQVGWPWVHPYPHYAPPEMGWGEHLGRRSVVYSLGCILFECVTGSRPFEGDWLALTEAHSAGPIPPVSERRPELGTALDAVLARALAKDAGERFQSAGELVSALDAALTIAEQTGDEEAATSKRAHAARRAILVEPSAEERHPDELEPDLETPAAQPPAETEREADIEAPPAEPARPPQRHPDTEASPPNAPAPAAREARAFEPHTDAQPPPVAPHPDEERTPEAGRAPEKQSPSPVQRAPTLEPHPDAEPVSTDESGAEGEAVFADDSPAGRESPPAPPSEHPELEPVVEHMPDSAEPESVEQLPEGEHGPAERERVVEPAAELEVEPARPQPEVEPELEADVGREAEPEVEPEPPRDPESEPDAEPEWVVRPEAERKPPRRRKPAVTRRRTPTRGPTGVAIVALVVVAACALAGFLVGNAATPSAEPAKVATVGPLSLELPADWERRTARGALPGVPLRGAVAAGPRRSQAAGIVAGRTERTGKDFLPSGMTAPREIAEPVRLGRYDGYRHRGLRTRGSTSRVTVYSIPTTGGAAVLACHAPPAAARGFLPTCERVASTIHLRGLRTMPLSVLLAERRRLARAVAKLRRRRAAGRRRLAAARTPSRQAREARALQAAYSDARRSFVELDAAAEPPGWKARVLTAVKRIEGAYRRLARAAARRSRSGYARGGRSVNRSEAVLARVVAGAGASR